MIEVPAVSVVAVLNLALSFLLVTGATFLVLLRITESHPPRPHAHATLTRWTILLLTIVGVVTALGIFLPAETDPALRALAALFRGMALLGVWTLVVYSVQERVGEGVE